MSMSPVTYYGDLRPILVENCTMCHTAGGIAPFTLEGYDDAALVADRLVEVTRDRIMPPFLADNSGSCNTWSNYRGLTDAEIATFADWVEGGLAVGNPDAPVPEAPTLPTLASVDLTLEMPSTYGIIEADDDDYRCFVVDTGLTASKYVTGYDVHPGNPQRVHHVIVYNPTSASQADSARALDAADGTVGDGYPCFGGPRVEAAPVVLWAPGTGATRFPRGTGVQVSAGVAQIIQVHYNNLVPDSPNTDRTSIDLTLADDAVPAYLAPLGDYSLNLAPRMEAVTESATQSLSWLPTNVYIHGVFPHMHTLGTSLTIELNDGDQCVIDVPRWDFNWQLAYWLDRSIRIGPSDVARISCTYNTMERDTVTNWGDGTQDEMCIAFVYVTATP